MYSYACVGVHDNQESRGSLRHIAMRVIAPSQFVSLGGQGPRPMAPFPLLSPKQLFPCGGFYSAPYPWATPAITRKKSLDKCAVFALVTANSAARCAPKAFAFMRKTYTVCQITAPKSYDGIEKPPFYRPSKVLGAVPGFPGAFPPIFKGFQAFRPQDTCTFFKTPKGVFFKIPMRIVTMGPGKPPFSNIMHLDFSAEKSSFTALGVRLAEGLPPITENIVACSQRTPQNNREHCRNEREKRFKNNHEENVLEQLRTTNNHELVIPGTTTNKISGNNHEQALRNNHEKILRNNHEQKFWEQPRTKTCRTTTNYSSPEQPRTSFTEQPRTPLAEQPRIHQTRNNHEQLLRNNHEQRLRNNHEQNFWNNHEQQLQNNHEQALRNNHEPSWRPVVGRRAERSGGAAVNRVGASSRCRAREGRRPPHRLAELPGGKRSDGWPRAGGAPVNSVGPRQGYPGLYRWTPLELGTVSHPREAGLAQCRTTNKLYGTTTNNVYETTTNKISGNNHEQQLQNNHEQALRNNHEPSWRPVVGRRAERSGGAAVDTARDGFSVAPDKGRRPPHRLAELPGGKRSTAAEGLGGAPVNSVGASSRVPRLNYLAAFGRTAGRGALRSTGEKRWGLVKGTPGYIGGHRLSWAQCRTREVRVPPTPLAEFLAPLSKAGRGALRSTGEKRLGPRQGVAPRTSFTEQPRTTFTETTTNKISGNNHEQQLQNNHEQALRNNHEPSGGQWSDAGPRGPAERRVAPDKGRRPPHRLAELPGGKRSDGWPRGSAEHRWTPLELGTVSHPREAGVRRTA
ncbi:hypothetical protein PR048_033782 [Dryococelus australis]|uniref:Uncharacterized protein n=1 Tax=Dryococelus australis TaxID=614101 RepID=A0ABQ9FYY9_9NEOP|nr:hypothetical protein PR048_033782 [Dryococelus australis]